MAEVEWVEDVKDKTTRAISENIKADFEQWESLFKELVNKLYSNNGSTYTLKKNEELAANIAKIHNGATVQYMAQSIGSGQGMNVFGFFAAFNKVHKQRNKIASTILDKDINLQYYGVPAGQMGITPEKLQANNHEIYNHIAFWLINHCNEIIIENDLKISCQGVKYDIKTSAPVYKNAFYLLCPKRFYPSDTNTQDYLGNKNPLLQPIPEGDELAIRAESYLAYDNKLENGKDGNVNKVESKNIAELLKYQKQIILQGPPGTGKTRVAKIIAINMLVADSEINDGSTNEEIKEAFEELGDDVQLIQFHPSFSYEDFVRGITAKSTDTQIEYIVENKILAQMAQWAKKAWDDAKEKTDAKKFILIIDEINRANLSSVLGELIYALEYRDEAVESMYEHPTEGRKITLPSNLYIIGTMNTADRSIGHMDYAIRRRFSFETILPNKDVADDEELFERVQTIFKENISPEFNADDVMLGHSYFIGDVKTKLKYQIKPLLKEYVKDGVLNESAMKSIEELVATEDSK